MRSQSLWPAVLLAAAAWTAPAQAAQISFEAAAENPQFEWFFLIVDAGRTQGIWARNGLDPQFVAAAGSALQLEQAVRAGVKLGLVNTAEVLLARAAALPVKIVAGYFGQTTARIFVAESSAIRSAEDLDRRKIGIVATTHTSFRAVLFLNKQLGIVAEPVPLGSLQNNLAALKAGQIDAFYSAEGAAVALAKAGQARLLLPLASIYPHPYTAVVVWTTDDLIRSNRDLVRRFVRATLETVGFLKAHPSEATRLYISRTGAAPEVAGQAVDSLLQVLAPRGTGSGPDLISAVKGSWRFTIESGAVSAEQNLRIEAAVDTSFLP